MDPFAAAVQDFLSHEPTMASLAVLDMEVAWAVSKLSPTQLLFHALQHIYPDKIELKQIRATAKPFNLPRLILARSGYLSVNGEQVHMVGKQGMQQELAKFKARIPQLLKNHNLPADTLVSMTRHSIRPTRENLRMLCPELFGLIEQAMPAHLARQNAKLIDQGTAAARARTSKARL